MLSRRQRIGQLRRFEPPTRVIFGAGPVPENPQAARRFAAIFSHSELHLLPDAGDVVEVHQPKTVAEGILAEQRG